MKKNKSHGPYGFPLYFYQYFWEMIKCILKVLPDDFHAEKADISRINYGVITLVPKTKDAKQIQKFRPIYLLNVNFKIITEVLVNRLSKVVNPIISPL